ncbi:hypothetical protein WJX81_003631 [Elliptochloris bilobata]|uniref:Uncharacterized protein n=1 Tax=Elliptochloris bilobata TaxID=381761 RepID=A0AAW1SJX8_9CHLO
MEGGPMHGAGAVLKLRKCEQEFNEELSQLRLAPFEFEALMRALGKTREASVDSYVLLHTLDVCGDLVTDAALRLLLVGHCWALGTFATLTNLRLRNCQLAPEALNTLSLATDVLQRLQRLDLGENQGLALSGTVGPMQNMQAMLLSFESLQLLALDHCGFSDDDTLEVCDFVGQEAHALLRSLRCLQLGPPCAACGAAVSFSDGTWQALSEALAACERLEVAYLWGASDEQAGAWSAELRADEAGQAATVICTPLAAPSVGLHVRLSTLPREARSELEEWPAAHILPPEPPPAAPAPAQAASGDERLAFLRPGPLMQTFLHGPPRVKPLTQPSAQGGSASAGSGRSRDTRRPGSARLRLGIDAAEERRLGQGRAGRHRPRTEAEDLQPWAGETEEIANKHRASGIFSAPTHARRTVPRLSSRQAALEGRAQAKAEAQLPALPSSACREPVLPAQERRPLSPRSRELRSLLPFGWDPRRELHRPDLIKMSCGVASGARVRRPTRQFSLLASQEPASAGACAEAGADAAARQTQSATSSEVQEDSSDALDELPLGVLFAGLAAARQGQDCHLKQAGAVGGSPARNVPAQPEGSMLGCIVCCK